LDVKQISDLIDILSRSDVSTLKYEEESFKLTLMKERPASQPVAAAQPALQAMGPAHGQVQEVVSSAHTSAAPAAVPAEQPGPPPEDLAEIATPFVGTYYAAPTPDADPFVKVGSRVTQGQVMCIVEAMKLMNEIEAEFSGEVVEILATNGQPVEFGEVLFRIRPS
jgi:acetyl-CoA carboxylase biotin carboxyl carrier protein